MYYTVKDATYWYEVYGEGEPVVLLHGFTGSTATWSECISNWKEQFQIIVVDLPGHGKTKTQSPRTMEACCADLNQLFTSLQLDSVHLAGYSMGGRTRSEERRVGKECETRERRYDYKDKRMRQE